MTPVCGRRAAHRTSIVATALQESAMTTGPASPVTPAESIARAWLAEMESCVRAQDYARCRAIFADDVTGFGTREAMAIGLDALERDQWRHVWGRIRGFTFLTDQLRCGIGGDDVAWLACPWTSEGPDGAGGWVRRPGRISAILQRRDGAWLAIHTHHSLAPEPAD
jgi:ketosteroid isomerase-like protein